MNDFKNYVIWLPFGIYIYITNNVDVIFIVLQHRPRVIVSTKNFNYFFFLFYINVFVF